MQLWSKRSRQIVRSTVCYMLLVLTLLSLPAPPSMTRYACDLLRWLGSPLALKDTRRGVAAGWLMGFSAYKLDVLGFRPHAREMSQEMASGGARLGIPIFAGTKTAVSLYPLGVGLRRWRDAMQYHLVGGLGRSSSALAAAEGSLSSLEGDDADAKRFWEDFANEQDQMDTFYPGNTRVDESASHSGAIDENPDRLPSLPAPSPEAEGGARRLEVGGAALKLEELGPMVLNVDGTVSRITNWASLTERERRATVRVLTKRNAERAARLQQVQREGVPQPHQDVQGADDGLQQAHDHG